MSDYIVFDLEWNQSAEPENSTPDFPFEIIEIGAVKIDEDANVLDTFSIHLRPRIFRKFQHHIAKVTGLTPEPPDNRAPSAQGQRA